MTNKPYSFPLRSRKAMVDYLTDRTSYSDHYQRYVFNWNVKARHVNWRHPQGECAIRADLDADWESELQKRDYEQRAFEDARRYVEDGWTSYPGDDQGDWEFYFLGRNGGHLCLEKWRGRDMRDLDPGDFANWSLADLRAFYRGIVCADSDFTPEKASKEVERHLNYQRAEWEREIDESRDCTARKMENARPDMYS